MRDDWWRLAARTGEMSILDGPHHDHIAGLIRDGAGVGGCCRAVVLAFGFKAGAPVPTAKPPPDCC